MNADLSVSLINRGSEIARVHTLTVGFCHQHGVPQPVINVMGLVLEELLTNLLSHGYTDEAEHAIALRVRLNEAELELELEDDGRPFNPLEFPPPDVTLPLDQRPLGGLGVHLVRRMMDGMEYRRIGDRNVLRLRKRLTP